MIIDVLQLELRNTNLGAVDVEHVSAALDDGHEGDEDEGEQLQHGAYLPYLKLRNEQHLLVLGYQGPISNDVPTHPSGHVVVAGGGGCPVKHLLEAARLEGHDTKHHQADGDALQSK